jgi:Fe-S-cluster containining protein
VRSLRDLDHALYLLNFERIQLGLSITGDWSVYYRYPCRFLDRSDPGNYLCTIHETPLQPRICVHYNPFSCWYKRALGSGQAADFVALDRRRLEVIAERLVFDDDRNILETPDWPGLVALVQALPLDPAFDAEPEPDPVFEQWLIDSATHAVPIRTPRRRTYHQLVDACAGCAAHCCKTLVFPLARPTARRNLDYMQFLLGFPGIEVGVTDDAWVLVVRTRCRHLTAENRCGVYGRPERPSLCRYFDATSCSYVVQFGEPRPPGFLRLQLDQFFWMVDAIMFDADGAILDMPAMERMRRVIESRWYEAVNAPAADSAATPDAGDADRDGASAGDDAMCPQVMVAPAEPEAPDAQATGPD